jgi:hypothetical protein
MCQYFSSPLIYSPQGFWATLTGIIYYGSIGMTKEFLARLRKGYPELDEDMEWQLWDFIIWYNELADDWQYEIGQYREICSLWFRGIIKYLCRKESNLYEDIDLIETYRNLIY